ncbi:MAG: hypothetical protein ACR2OR_09290 [Hyphomicrobiales bacterium]
MDRLGKRAAAAFLFFGLMALLAGWFDVANDPLSYIFAVLLGMPWTFAVDALATNSLFWNSVMMICAICINAAIVYMVFSWIGRRLSGKRED